MPNVTVSDTSCLILLDKIGGMELLQKMFGTILISETVAKEFQKPVPAWVETVHPKTSIHSEPLLSLDKGEADSILLALEHDESLLIIDEIKGRKIAKELGVQITGSLGVLVAAKKHGYIPSVKSYLTKMEQTNFRISGNLISAVLQKANEK